MRPYASMSIAAMLLAMALAGPAGAFHDPPFPTLASGASGAAGWVSVPIAFDGGGLEFEVQATFDGRAAVAAAIYRDGALVGMATFAAFAEYDGTFVDVSVAEGLEYSTDTRRDGLAISLTLVVALSGAPAGSYGGVLWSAGSVERWSWAIRGESGSVPDLSSGRGTLLATSADFRGVAALQAFDAGTGARANLATELATETVHGLVGLYEATSEQSVNVMSAITPAGTRACGCTFAGGAPGTYTFRDTGAGAGQGALTDVLIVAADAPAPI